MARRSMRFIVVIAVMLAEFGFGQATVNTAPLTIEQLIDIKHPSNPVWAPNGKYVAFIWDRAGVSNLYFASSNGGGQPIPLTSFPEGGVDQIFWSQDSQTVYFSRNGDLWQVAVSGSAPKPVWTTPAGESDIVPSPDGGRVAFVRSNHAADEESSKRSELVVRSLADGSETSLASDEFGIHGIVWSPDGSSLAYTAGAKVIHHDEAPSYSGAKIIYRTSEYKPGQIHALRLGGRPVAIGTAADYGGVGWLDNSHLVFDQVSSNFKTYTINVADASGGPLRSVYEITEKEFWSIPDWGEAGAQPWPSPDGKWIAFLSDRDGWDHLYVVSASGGEATQLTKGHFEAWRPAWSHDSKHIAFDANEADHLGDRQIGIAAIGTDPTHAVITYITGGNGTNIEPHWSADDKQLVYQRTDTRNSADLFVVEAKANAKAVRLSDSMPASMDKSQFVEPQFVHFPGPDGKQVPGWLFVPRNLDRSKKHAAIVWVHGDGVNQNYDGWHVQRNYAVYYSFHQYLLQQGYVVFAPDYRGSIGYGRDWRNGVFMDVGGKDAKDAWMSANFLKTLPYVDADRIGIWGLSYGGFFTLIAMTDQPTLFKAGVDVAGVVDYVMYYSDPYHGDWTESRIGRPDQNPQVYAQASPISHIDRLARPLLVLHGTADVNVPYLESVWLIDEALKKNKGDLLSFMMYPGEFHYFTRAHVLNDAWHRVDDFFGYHLQGRINPPERGN
ncbi:MAG TPA: prolyl oligopeptidase family serine peptidase [Candidatus Sulfotelmatobacter sp.]|nr:prolyl oligopeptidase family serine peptidase [Candidatus Sulfotelmatobacter sp.]